MKFVALLLMFAGFSTARAATKIGSCENQIKTYFAKQSKDVVSIKKVSENYGMLDLYEVRTPSGGDGSFYWLVITSPDWQNELNDCEVKSAEIARIYTES